MDLLKLRKEELLELSRALEIDIPKAVRKADLIAEIAKTTPDDEIQDVWNSIVEKKEKEAAREADEQEQRRQNERQAAREAAEQERQADLKREELALRRLELERGAAGFNVTGYGEGRESFKMSKYMQPFKVEDDIGLYLVNFERTCERMSFHRNTWPQRLLTLLPGEAAEVMARLSTSEAANYDVVKISLLRKYRLSAEAFRLKFRNATKKPGEAFTEFE